MRELILFAIMFVAISGVIGLMIGWSKFLDWRTSVKSSRIIGADLMSRAQEEATAKPASSLQTRPDQTQDQTIDPKVRRAKMLDTYRMLRKYGMSRVDARDLLNPWGIPLDNNLWADAAPPAPDDAMSITPIAGRPTPAKFHDDPELEYQPLR